jgi:hypothetical protein
VGIEENWNKDSEANGMKRKRDGRACRVGPGSRWSKQFLLPLPHESVRSLSLSAHLALEACRTRAGNQHMFNELTRLTYLAFFMWDAGVGGGDTGVFNAAEAVLNAAVSNVERTGTWQVEEANIGAIEALLAVYDEQLATAPVRVYLESVGRLDRLLAVPRSVSPLLARARR